MKMTYILPVYIVASLLLNCLAMAGSWKNGEGSPIEDRASGGTDRSEDPYYLSKEVIFKSILEDNGDSLKANILFPLMSDLDERLKKNRFVDDRAFYIYKMMRLNSSRRVLDLNFLELDIKNSVYKSGRCRVRGRNSKNIALCTKNVDSTRDGSPDIIFDIEKLDFNISRRDIAAHLFHEHARHFFQDGKNVGEENERLGHPLEIEIRDILDAKIIDLKLGSLRKKKKSPSKMRCNIGIESTIEVASAVKNQYFGTPTGDAHQDSKIREDVVRVCASYREELLKKIIQNNLVKNNTRLDCPCEGSTGSMDPKNMPIDRAEIICTRQMTAEEKQGAICKKLSECLSKESIAEAERKDEDEIKKIEQRLTLLNCPKE